ncbi:hypothetical protein AIOL_002368 [Candidatus Rhodobacter oscarellae]|uniref:Uncharacterized protein n=2 Tax=Candidatus Rhodobacter oscarellae TaxID=1675527 RepID=A0A0J9E3N2_9RHOB|nr:hypothetical protein AIOL_002368 [Candidatus Rhodobacter lobularis]
MNGHRAHSHIFLPRLEVELRKINPAILDRFAKHALQFTPGSKRLTGDVPQECRRLFATRWQTDSALLELFGETVGLAKTQTQIQGAALKAGSIRQLDLQDNAPLSVQEDTLVIDAMGGNSPLMSDLLVQTGAGVDQPSNVVYVTQFFRLDQPSSKGLPDPLIECGHDFGALYMTLYPAQGGWFSLTLAIHAEHRDLVRKFREPDAFLELANSHPKARVWLSRARAVGPNRMFIKPRNRWNVGVLTADGTPKNYVPVGDALTSMNPTLGANCSFSATHIRIARDLVRDRVADFPSAYAALVTKEQYAFFEGAIAANAPPKPFVAYKDARQSRWDKRLNRTLRKLRGRDKPGIQNLLKETSSLNS